MAAEHQLQQQQPAKTTAGGSRFAVTCGLLRQYMKEQGGTRCLAPAVAMGLMPEADAASAALATAEERTTVLELFPQQAGTLKDEQQRCVQFILRSAAEERTTVLELFPQQAGTLKDEQQRKRKEPADGRAPLTIFYGGKMVVFDDFPAVKAEELMQLAGGSGVGNTTAPPAAADAQQNALGQPSFTDMPLARKVSLKRFLEKRKNRLTAADPYPATAAAAASESSTKQPSAVKDEGAPWLGVSSALSLS